MAFKKILLAVASLCSLLVIVLSSLNAQFEGPITGYQDTSIPQLKNLPDDSKVQLEGYIIQRVGDDDYLFRDDSGSTVIVEIDNDLWLGRKVIPENHLRIQGEWDKSRNPWKQDQLEADSFQILQANITQKD